MKKSELRQIIREEIQTILSEGFPHKSKRAAFEVRSYSEFLDSQKGSTPQYPDHFLVNKKTWKIEAGYGSYNVPDYTKYSGPNKTDYTIISKSSAKNPPSYLDRKPLDYTKKQNWVK